MTGSPHRTLDPEGWLRVLADASSRLQWTLCGHTTTSPGWVFEKRVLRDHLMYLIVDGAMEVVAPDGRMLTAGEFLWISPGVAHTFRQIDDQPFTLFHIRFRLAAGSDYIRLRRRSVFVSPADALAPHFARLYDEYHSHHRFRRQTQRALLLLICAEALRSQDVSRADAGRVLTTAQRRLLIQFADANVATRYSPDDLSAVVGLSPDYFARLFRRSFGLPPRTWIMQHRIRQAANALLESNRTVTEVAFSLGYDDIYLFSRQFRQVMGLAPTPWRRQAGR